METANQTSSGIMRIHFLKASSNKQIKGCKADSCWTHGWRGSGCMLALVCVWGVGVGGLTTRGSSTAAGNAKYNNNHLKKCYKQTHALSAYYMHCVSVDMCDSSEFCIVHTYGFQ